MMLTGWAAFGLGKAEGEGRGGCEDEGEETGTGYAAARVRLRARGGVRARRWSRSEKCCEGQGTLPGRWDW